MGTLRFTHPTETDGETTLMGTSRCSFTHPTKKPDEHVYVGWVKERSDAPINTGQTILSQGSSDSSNTFLFTFK